MMNLNAIAGLAAGGIGLVVLGATCIYCKIEFDKTTKECNELINQQKRDLENARRNLNRFIH